MLLDFLSIKIDFQCKFHFEIVFEHRCIFQSGEKSGENASVKTVSISI